MKYILDNKSDKIKSVNENKLEGLQVDTKNNNLLNATKILIVDSELKDAYIKKRVNKKIVALLAKMQYILDNEEDGNNNAALVLGEIDRLKSIIINFFNRYSNSSTFKCSLYLLIIILVNSCTILFSTE